MAAKTANVLARVEPEIKAQAEDIMSQLGVPASVVINMLYKQIILTKSIPFPLSLPTVRDTMDEEAFAAIMQRGPQEAKADRSRPVDEVFQTLREELMSWQSGTK